jgi:hypothetical protein
MSPTSADVADICIHLLRYTYRQGRSGRSSVRPFPRPCRAMVTEVGKIPMQELPDGTKISRAPKDMQSWEIIATYRHAWALATYVPSGYLAKALANWKSTARHELEQRGEWHPEKLPPQSM